MTVMRLGLHALLLLPFLVLPACPFYRPFILVNPELNTGEIRTMIVEGTFTHAGTQITFPTTLAGFHRTELLAYGPTEHNVSVTYESGNPFAHIFITVYVYPRQSQFYPSDLHEQLAQALEQVKRRYPDTADIETGDVILDKDAKAIVGRFAMFQYKRFMNGGNRDVKSAVFLFGTKDWFIKYRVSRPLSQEGFTARKLDRFMDGFRWFDEMSGI